MWRAYLTAEDVALTLVANAEVGLAVEVGLAAWFLAIFVRGTIHKPVRVHLLPHTKVRPWCMMVQLILVKVTVQLALLIVTTEIRKCDANPEMMWAAQAAGGRSSRLRVHVCMDCTLSTMGRRAR